MNVILNDVIVKCCFECYFERCFERDFGCWLNLKPFNVVLDVNIVMSCFECCFQKAENGVKPAKARSWLKFTVGF